MDPNISRAIRAQIERAIPDILSRAKKLNAFPKVENWHEVGGPGEPAFENSFTNYSLSSWSPVAYCKDPFGWVRLRGLATKSGSAPSTVQTIFTLPGGYRPDRHETFSTPVGEPVSVGFTNQIHARITVLPTGEVQLTGTSATMAETDYTSLYGISFRAI